MPTKSRGKLRRQRVAQTLVVSARHAHAVAHWRGVAGSVCRVVIKVPVALVKLIRWRWSAAEADLGNDGSGKTTKATIAAQVTNHVARARCLNLVFLKEKVSTKGAADKFGPFSVTFSRIDKMQFLLTVTTQNDSNKVLRF
jgi:hypothetical protein